MSSPLRVSEFKPGWWRKHFTNLSKVLSFRTPQVVQFPADLKRELIKVKL
jgi:hypothetical protein